MEGQNQNRPDVNRPGRLLIVDDEPAAYEALMKRAIQEGFEVSVVSDGLGAIEAFRSFRPDLILLDIVMPGMDGFQVCREIRKESEVPIIFISVKKEENHRVMGLDMGADDYITKPFSSREVMARVRAVLRRLERGERRSRQKIFCVSNLTINIENYTVYVGEELLDMTKKEVETMWLLAGNPGRAFSREELLDYLWGEDYIGDGRSLDSHIKRMRSKFREVEHSEWDIKTIWGLGYKFELNIE